MMRRWHFPLTQSPDKPIQVVPGTGEATAIVDEGIKTGNLQMFSEGLHPFQDSWSHQGVGSKHYEDKERGVYAQFGHPEKRGGALSTETDQTYTHPDEVIGMARQTLEKMIEYRKQNEHLSVKKADEIRERYSKENMEDFKNFINASSKQEKLDWLRNHKIELSSDEIKDITLRPYTVEPVGLP